VADGRPVFLRGIGSDLPSRVLTNRELEKIVDTSDEWIFTRTGIRERRILDQPEATSDMALRASRRALEDAGLGADGLDLVVVGTTTPDVMFPSTGCLLAQKLKAGDIPAFDLQAACSGFLYAFSVGVQFVASGTARNVLVVGAETLSRVTDYRERGTCILFGDGAGAAVLSCEGDGHRVLDTHLRANADQSDALCLLGGGSRHPFSEEVLQKRLHYVQMKGREVFKLAILRMIEVLEETFKRNGLSVQDVALMVPHQMNRRIMEVVCERIGLSMERVMVNIDRCGNTSSASVPIALDEAYRTGRIRRGDLVVLVVFGGGFTWGTAVVRW
jgi:3-oxoacyl-[acyl-carrier-protein] synthase-3